MRPMPISRFVPISLFVQAASVGMVFALLHEVQDENNLSTASIGLISSAGLLAAVFGQVGLAPLADRGKGRELMVGAMVVGSLGAVGFALGDDVWQLVAARAISGAALGAFDPAAQALVTTRDPDRAGELLGKLIEQYPGMNNHMEQGIAVSVDGTMYRDDWDVEIPDGVEVVLLPRIQGG